MSNKVAFLKFFINGGDPDALFQEGANLQTEELALRTERMVQRAVADREVLASQAKAVAEQLTEETVLEDELQALQRAHQKVDALTRLQGELKTRVQTDRQMVQYNQQIVDGLQMQLQELRQVFEVLKGPSYHEKKIAELGSRICRRMGEP